MSPCESEMSRYILDRMEKKRDKMLTVRMDLDTLAAYSAAVDIFNGRDVSAFTHNFVVETINGARKQVGEEQFQSLVETRRQKMLENGAQKAQQAKAAKEERARNLKRPDLGQPNANRTTLPKQQPQGKRKER